MYFYSSYKLSHKRGVATLISSTLNYEHISETKDKEGRFVKITGRIEGTEITLLNVYAPPGCEWSFYRHIFDLMVSSQGVVICGGDFNIRLNPALDSSRMVTQNKPLTRKMNSLMEELGIIDVWRELHPTSKDNTHYSFPHSAYSRIDYFFIFNTDRLRIKICNIATIDLSDHSPVSMSLILEKKMRKTLWRLSSHILNNPKVMERLRGEIKEYLDLNDTGETSPVILWDTLKAVLRGKIISITTHMKKINAQKLADLQGKLKQLQVVDSNKSNSNRKQEIRKLQSEIDDIYTLETQRNFLYLREKSYEVGGKSARLLAYKLRIQQADNTIHKIKNPKTKLVESTIGKIQESFETYYRELYAQPQAPNEPYIDSVLNFLDLPKLTDLQNESLLEPVTVKELNVAISRLKAGKSPGSDGFTSEWYKSLKTQLAPLLFNTFNWILQRGETPPSWREAIISVIPKEGKDKLECGNYWPISVLNLDYKLFTSILARRLEKLLPCLIHLDQTGFIQQRQTQDNIRRTLHILEQVNKNKTETVVVGLDAEKAFDSVSWAFLYRVLGRFGFQEKFIKVIQTLYDSPTAGIKINGDLSDSFILERGTRQGCPISPLLFALYIEPLAQLIKQSEIVKGIKVAGIEQKVALFADDVLVYLSEPEKSFIGLFTLLDDFGKISGYKINVKKMQVMSLNYTPSKKLEDTYDLKWEAKSLKYLGITLPKDLSTLSQVNYGPLISEIKADIHRWNLIPFLSLNSRINTIKMNILPRLLYLFCTLLVEVDDNQFREWDKWISRFIWQGKKPRIRYNTLQLGKEGVGMVLPCLRNYFYASQITPLLYWCNREYKARWKEIEFGLVHSFPLQSSIADEVLMAQVEKFKNSWINLTLKVWQKVVNSCGINNMLKLFRWCAYDTEFLPNRGDKRFELWIKKGLTTYLSFIDKRVLQSFQILQDKHGLEHNDYFRYLRVRNYVNQSCRYIDLSTVELEFFKILNLACSSIPSKSVSQLYNALSHAKNVNTLYIKEKWEKEAGLVLSEEAWGKICSFQWSSTNSLTWREHCWKKHYKVLQDPISGKI
ncbi:3-hydroxy-3-methylglutaryl-CoA reductase a isoform X1 [Mobula birostris]|uniref:3-hydroxy-3-methylglutaryl-CoA reductase a isoform X1 n=1 Tax=Mobula birostris TaxID=1983395 RepID=UPI003B27DCFB